MVLGSTGRYRALQGGIGRYRALQGTIGLCRAVQGCRGRYRLYRVVQGGQGTGCGDVVGQSNAKMYLTSAFK